MKGVLHGKGLRLKGVMMNGRIWKMDGKMEDGQDAALLASNT